MKQKKATDAQLRQSYADLGTIYAVAKRHGYASAGMVASRLRQMGVARHRPGLSLDARNLHSLDEALAVYREAGSYAKAAPLLGTTPDALRVRLSRAKKRGEL